MSAIDDLFTAQADEPAVGAIDRTIAGPEVIEEVPTTDIGTFFDDLPEIAPESKKDAEDSMVVGATLNLSPDQVKAVLEWDSSNKQETDETRAEALRLDNQLSPEAMMVVPNAPMGEAKEVRGRYFNDMFGIGSEKKIALYTGGIADYNLTYEHIESTVTWPDNVVTGDQDDY